MKYCHVIRNETKRKEIVNRTTTNNKNLRHEEKRCWKKRRGRIGVKFILNLREDG